MRILELYNEIRRGRLRGELPPGMGGHVLEPVVNQKERRAIELKVSWAHSAIEVKDGPGLGIEGRKKRYGTR